LVAVFSNQVTDDHLLLQSCWNKIYISIKIAKFPAELINFFSLGSHGSFCLLRRVAGQDEDSTAALFVAGFSGRYARPF
jgi:hypothetical protein